MRRRPGPGPAWPAWVERYDPREWPEGPQAWYDACAEWQRANPDVDVPAKPGPDVPWDPEEDPP